MQSQTSVSTLFLRGLWITTTRMNEKLHGQTTVKLPEMLSGCRWMGKPLWETLAPQLKRDLLEMLENTTHTWTLTCRSLGAMLTRERRKERQTGREHQKWKTKRKTGKEMAGRRLGKQTDRSAAPSPETTAPKNKQ